MSEALPLRTIIEYIIALLDLAEAEGRALRRALVAVLIGLIAIATGGFLLIAGVGLCISGVYAGFIWVFSGNVFAAGLITGAITLLLAGGVLWIGKLMMRG